MNVVLVRVLYAHALVLDGDLALGRLYFPGAAGRPSAVAGSAGVVVDERRFARSVSDRWRRGGGDHRQGEQARPDDGLRGDRRAGRRAVRVLARALDEPRLLDLVNDGAPAYAWPADQRHVWKPQAQRRFTSLIEFLTRPRISGLRLEPAMT